MSHFFTRFLPWVRYQARIRPLLAEYQAQMHALRHKPDASPVDRLSRWAQAGTLVTSVLELVTPLLPLEVQAQVAVVLAEERALWERHTADTQSEPSAPSLAELALRYGPPAAYADYAIGDQVAFVNVMDEDPPDVQTGIVLYVCAPLATPQGHLPLCYVIGRNVPGRDFPALYFVTARFLLGTLGPTDLVR